MTLWAETLPQHVATYGLTAIGTALGLTLLSLALLAREKRKKTVGSLILFGSAAVLWGASQIPQINALSGGALGLISHFLLLCCGARSLCLIVWYSRFTSRFFETQPRIAGDIVFGLAYATALMVVLYRAGVSPGSLFASSAIVTAVIGYVLKDTLGNIFSGLALQVEQPFQAGDWIQFDADKSHIGQVVEVNWRATKVLTLDQVHVVIPNALLSQTSLTNFSTPTPCSRRSVYVVAPYHVPPEHVQKIILDSLQGMPGLLTEPRASVVTNAFNERGIEYWVRIFTNDFHIRDRVDGEARNRIWYAFQRHGITFPGTQHEVSAHLHRRQHPEERDQEHHDHRRKLLKNVDFFRGLPDAALDLLAAESRRALFGSGECIIREGDLGNELFILTKGSLTVSVSPDNGAPLTVGTLVPPQFFGEKSFLTGELRSATATAAEPCECLVIGHRAMSTVMASTPHLAEEICEALQLRRAASTAAMAQSNRPALEEKTADGDLLQAIRDFFGL